MRELEGHRGVGGGSVGGKGGCEGNYVTNTTQSSTCAEIPRTTSQRLLRKQHSCHPNNLQTSPSFLPRPHLHIFSSMIVHLIRVSSFRRGSSRRMGGRVGEVKGGIARCRVRYAGQAVAKGCIFERYEGLRLSLHDYLCLEQHVAQLLACWESPRLTKFPQTRRKLWLTFRRRSSLKRKQTKVKTNTRDGQFAGFYAHWKLGYMWLVCPQYSFSTPNPTKRSIIDFINSIQHVEDQS